MSFAGIPFGEGTFAGVGYIPAVTAPGGGGGSIGGPPEVQIIIDPFTIEISGQSMKGFQLIDSLTIDKELGRQGTAQFSLYNIGFSPQIGEPVRILYYNDILFVGAVDRITVTSNNAQTFVTYNFECTDNSYLLFRRKVRMNFVNQPVYQIALGVLADGALRDGITIGTVDNNFNIPLANADGVSAYEFLSGIAVSTGTLFSIDNNRVMHFTSVSLTPAPVLLNGDTVQSCTVEIDRETYRNEQWTVVTGTAATQSETPLVIELRRGNDEQIAAQAVIEDTGGNYRDITQITHPSSNSAVELTKLGNAYNKIYLGLSGAIRRSLNITTRQVGFIPGHIATVSLPQVGATGEWVISRTSLREESGRFLITSLQLRQTSIMRRAQELWVEVVRRGTLSILPPSAIYTNIVHFTTPGIGSWAVPSGVTDIQITVRGGGGGGGGGAKSIYFNKVRTAAGAAGGSGGLAIKVMTVTPGTVLTYWVGAGGLGGASDSDTNTTADTIGATGANGIETYVEQGGGKVVRAFPGTGALGGFANAYRNLSISYPQALSGNGSGGQAITVGGAANSGYAGDGITSSGGNGGNGKVTIEW